MKDRSYYQYMKTRIGEKGDIGTFASYITRDTMFPKYTQDYDEISDYLEKNPYPGISLSIFDASFNDFENWLLY
ncbi:YozE family protein [Corticicoccus populi]|uniref:YozE family protein n=1 Tax=Corticicoccus populi TaxID=1812821 RepID=A0ABW5WSS1_9STAP